MPLQLEPVFLLTTVPLEACIAGGGVLCTAIAAQWRANNKSQEASIEAITKSNSNSERVVSLVEKVVEGQSVIASKIDSIDQRIESLDKKVSRLPKGDTHHAASG